MIVKCDKCQTRFKIPDEKVTEKGVKVKCTKCQNTFRVARAASEASAPPPAAVDPDPFAKFGVGADSGSLEATRPGMFPEGIAASRAPTPSNPMSAVFGKNKELPREIFDEPTRIASVPKRLLDDATRKTSAETPAVAFDPSNPFPDGKPQGGFDPSDPFAGQPSAPPAPAKNTSFVSGPRASSLTDFEPTLPVSPSFPPPDAFPAAPPSAVSAAAKVMQSMPPAGSGEGSSGGGDPVASASGLLGALPPPDEAFGNDDGGPSGLSGEPDRGLFDMPAPVQAAPPRRIRLAVSEDLIETGPRPRPPLEQGKPLGSSSQMDRPAGRPEDVGMSERKVPGAVRNTLGLVSNIAFASVLVAVMLTVGTIYLNEGKVDPESLSLEPLKALFTRPSDLTAVDVSNGLYETSGDRPVFYVRGDVENRSGKPTRAKVKVEILDGALVLTTAEGLAGASPSPEELHSVKDAASLTALIARMDKDAVEVKPNGRAPFLLAFYDYPPELTQYRLKVTVTEAPAAGKTAAR